MQTDMKKPKNQTINSVQGNISVLSEKLHDFCHTIDCSDEAYQCSPSSLQASAVKIPE